MVHFVLSFLYMEHRVVQPCKSKTVKTHIQNDTTYPVKHTVTKFATIRAMKK